VPSQRLDGSMLPSPAPPVCALYVSLPECLCTCRRSPPQPMSPSQVDSQTLEFWAHRPLNAGVMMIIMKGEWRVISVREVYQYRHVFQPEIPPRCRGQQTCTIISQREEMKLLKFPLGTGKDFSRECFLNIHRSLVVRLFANKISSRHWMQHCRWHGFLFAITAVMTRHSGRRMHEPRV
jgi:hypothetical protein